MTTDIVLAPHELLALELSAPLATADDVTNDVDQQRAKRLAPIVDAWCKFIDGRMRALGEVPAGDNRQFSLSDVADTTKMGQTLASGCHANLMAILPTLITKLRDAGYSCKRQGDEHIVVTLPSRTQPED